MTPSLMLEDQTERIVINGLQGWKSTGQRDHWIGPRIHFGSQKEKDTVKYQNEYDKLRTWKARITKA